MASKKGIVITIVILAAITGGSFTFWTIPQKTESTFVISDYGNYLDGVKNIHEILQEDIDTEFQNLVDGKISPDEYITITKTTTSQVTAKISEFVTSKPTKPWQESYISYMDALKKFNSYIIETEVYANLIKDNGSQEEVSDVLKKIETLKTGSLEMARMSDTQRP